MDSELAGVWEHTLALGLGALAHANRHAAYMSFDNGRWPELAILQAAHAAELFIKARIAQEHPLLIFDELPKPQEHGANLGVRELFERGKTVQWFDLPARLWAATGHRLKNESTFRDFGRLRNGVQHFAPPPKGSMDALRFVFEVIDPFINECWGLFAVDYDEDDERYVYFTSSLVRREILFLVSPEAAKVFDRWDVDWSSSTPKYRAEMRRRAKRALQAKHPIK